MKFLRCNPDSCQPTKIDSWMKFHWFLSFGREGNSFWEIDPFVMFCMRSSAQYIWGCCENGKIFYLFIFTIFSASSWYDSCQPTGIRLNCCYLHNYFARIRILLISDTCCAMIAYWKKHSCTTYTIDINLIRSTRKNDYRKGEIKLVTQWVVIEISEPKWIEVLRKNVF